MRHTSKLLSLLLVSTIIASAPAMATEETKDPYEGNFFGNWGGVRTKLDAMGIAPTIEYKADVWSVTSGGIKRGNNYNDNLDIKFELDGEKLFGIKGNNAMVSFVNNNGGAPNARQVGSVQGIDNIETSTNTFKLYELWDEQSFFDNKLAVLVGLHDLNAEFDVTDMTANFIKPTMQIGQAFAQSGTNGPSVFPNTSLAGRVKFSPTEASYISAAVFDGIPGDPARPHGTHIDLQSRDGLLMVAEAGYAPAVEGVDGNPNKFAIGAWGYSKEMDDLVAVDGSGNPVKKRMAGAYALSSYQVYSDKKSGRDIGVFLRGGFADGNTAQVDWDYETGLVGHGWVPTRSDSEIGLGLSQSHNGDKYMQSVSGAADRNEYSLELYYRDQIVSGFSVQPDLQYVINPGTDPALDNATVVGIRFDINF